MPDMDGYTEKTVQQLAEAAAGLKDAIDPEEVIDLLYDLQGELIKGEYIEMFDTGSKSAIVNKLFQVKDFMRKLSKIEMIEK